MSRLRLARSVPQAAILCGALSAALVSPLPASAAWLPNGTPVGRVGSDDELPAYPVSLAPDETGGAFVVTGNNLDSGLGRFLGSGDPAPGWPGDGFAYSSVPYRSYFPVAIPDGTGGAFLVYNMEYCWAYCAGDGTELLVQHVTANGGLVPGWPEDGLSVGSGLERGYPIVALREPVSVSGADGSAILTWSTPQSTDERTFGPVELSVQRVDGNGTLPWGFGGVVVHSFANHRYDQAVSPDGRGGAYVFWLDERAPGLYGQHVRQDGKVSWAADGIPIAALPSTFVGSPVAVPDGEGGAIVAWAGTSGSRAGVFAARVAPGGARPWAGDRAVFDAGSLDVSGLRMVPTPSGGAILAWRASHAGGDDRILAQQLDREGRSAWGAPAPVCAAPGTRDHLAMTPDARGGAYFAWVDSRPAFSVYALHLEASGEPARGWAGDGSPLCGRRPSSTSPSGFVEITQLEMTATAGTQDPGRQPHTDRAQTPVRQAAGAIVAWVESPNGECEDCLHVDQRPLAMLLTPGGPATAPVAPTFAPTPASTAAPAALSPARAQVLSGQLAASGGTLVFGLSDASPATLELFDLAGRRLWSRDVGGLGAGVHQIRAGDGAWLPSGVYVARLVQRGHVTTARVPLIR